MDFCELIEVEGRLCLITAGRDDMNLGGLAELVVVPESYVVSVPAYSYAFDAAQLAQVQPPILLRPGATGYRFRFLPETGEFREDMQETDAGVYYDTALILPVQKDRPGITWLKHRMSLARYLVLYRDANGATKVLRNQRAKFALDTGKAINDLNAHTLTFRAAALRPAIHLALSPEQPLLSAFEQVAVSLRTQRWTFSGGFLAGQTLLLNFTPSSPDAVLLMYNDVLKLNPGDDYTISGRLVTLLFPDVPGEDSAATISAWYAALSPGEGLGEWVAEHDSYMTGHTAGATYTLASTPANAAHLWIWIDATAIMRPGIDYELDGNVVTWLVPGADEVGYSFRYVTAGTVTPQGWRHFRVRPAEEVISNYTFLLPEEPLPSSELLWLDETLLLEEGTHYTIVENEVEILFPVDTDRVFSVWHAH